MKRLLLHAGAWCVVVALILFLMVGCEEPLRTVTISESEAARGAQARTGTGAEIAPRARSRSRSLTTGCLSINVGIMCSYSIPMPRLLDDRQYTLDLGASRRGRVCDLHEYHIRRM